MAQTEPVRLDSQLKADLEKRCKKSLGDCVDEAVSLWLKLKAYEEYNLNFNFEEEWIRLLKDVMGPIQKEIESLEDEVDELKGMLVEGDLRVKEFVEYTPVSSDIGVVEAPKEEYVTRIPINGGSSRRIVDETVSMIANDVTPDEEEENQPEAKIDDDFPVNEGKEQKSEKEEKKTELIKSEPPTGFEEKIKEVMSRAPVNYPYEVPSTEVMVQKYGENAKKGEVRRGRGVYTPSRGVRSAVDRSHHPTYPRQSTGNSVSMPVRVGSGVQAYKGKYYEFDGKNPPKIKGVKIVMDKGSYVYYEDKSIWYRPEKRWQKKGSKVRMIMKYEGLL